MLETREVVSELLREVLEDHAGDPTAATFKSAATVALAAECSAAPALATPRVRVSVSSLDSAFDGAEDYDASTAGYLRMRKMTASGFSAPSLNN